MWSGLLGVLLVVIGGVGLIGTLLGYRGVLADLYGVRGVVLGLLLDGVFLVGGFTALRWGWRTRHTRRSFLAQFTDWLNEHSRTIGANFPWLSYAKPKARLAAVGLSALAAAVFWGTFALLTSDVDKSLILALPWWVGFSVFFWGLTVNVAKAYKWSIIAIPLLIIWLVVAAAVGLYDAS